MPIVPMLLSRRLRASPFEERVVEQGVTAFTLYNKMLLPIVFESYETTYQHLREHVQLWDVASERQVEIVGPDAARLVELITPRDISKCAIGQGVYAPLCDEHGGIINDPIILKLAEDRYWLSIADSDVLLWVKGVAYGRGFDVKVFEPDVSPLAVQGPKADDLMAEVVGEHTRDIKFFWFMDEEIVGTPVKIARSGWGGQGGFEIYLQDSSKGNELWDVFWQAGQKYNIRAGGPNLVDRLETGLKSYGQEMTIDSDPYEAALERYIHVDKEAEYMARDALLKIRETGPAKRLANLYIDGEPAESPRTEWLVSDTDGNTVGSVSSAAWSPKFDTNIAFATIDSAFSEPGTRLQVNVEGAGRSATVVDGRWQPASQE